MLTMCNVKTEYKKMVMHKKPKLIFCHIKMKIYVVFFLTRDYIFFAM